jgi:hypothetical protein
MALSLKTCMVGSVPALNRVLNAYASSRLLGGDDRAAQSHLARRWVFSATQDVGARIPAYYEEQTR